MTTLTLSGFSRLETNDNDDKWDERAIVLHAACDLDLAPPDYTRSDSYDMIRRVKMGLWIVFPQKAQ